MRLPRFAVLSLLLCIPAHAGRDEGDARLTLDIPLKEENPVQPLPETIVPLKRQVRVLRPEEDATYKRELVVVRARAWLTTGSVDTRISYQIPPQDITLLAGSQKTPFSLGETEQRQDNGLMLVYSAEVAPIRWLSGEFQYGDDSHKGSYGDHYWVDGPGWSQFQNFATGGIWNYPSHQDDLVLGSDASSHRDWAAGNIYARVLELRNRRPNDPVWHETLDIALGYERFRQNSSLTNLSVTMNAGKWYSPGLPVGPIAGFDSSYNADWTGPHFGIRDEVALPYGFSFDGLFLWSPFMVYRGKGYDNLGTYWEPVTSSSPNLIDTAHGTAVHFQLGARWAWGMFGIEAGYQRFYFYSRTGTRTFLAPDGSTSSMQLDFATAEVAGAYGGVTWRY
jgi:hypothetical protein